jgi:hypothetical protein
MHARGTFDVTITPQSPDNEPAKASGAQRMSINKRLHGDLEGISLGEMLAVGDGKTSGAYVALERVTGSLHGRNGSFALVHRGLMVHGKSEGWTVTVVPGSGTEELAGLSGEMTIIIKDDKHFYEVRYSLPET